MLSVWLRAIRVKFLLASVIAVSLGLSLAWHSGHPIDILHAILTFAGVISLHDLCEKCGRIPEEIENPHCSICGETPVQKSTNHYFCSEVNDSDCAISFS